MPSGLVVVCVGALSCLAWGTLVERRWYRLVRYRLHIPPTGSSLTLLHLSDLHLLPRDRAKVDFLARLPKADVTVVTGDFLGDPAAVETAVAAVRPARGQLASWFVLGSNDLFVPRPLNPLKYFQRRRTPRRAYRGRGAELAAQLAADGWQELSNVRREESLDGLPVEVLGLDDAHIDRHDLRIVPRRAEGRFGLAVMHSPDSAPEAAACGYDLIVAGHTHGGQIRLPVVGALVTNSHMPRRLASGLIRIGGSWMSLSPGLGTSKYAPFRFLCRPEATLLELRPAAGHSPAARVPA